MAVVDWRWCWRRAARALGSGSSGSSSDRQWRQRGQHRRLPEPGRRVADGGKRGGTLEVLEETDFEHLDPGIAYFSLDYEVVFATQRPLYSNKPNSNRTDARTWPRAAGNLRRQQDGHGAPQGRRSLQPAGQPRSDLAKTSRTRSSAAPTRTSPTRTSSRTSASIEGVPQATGGPIKGIETPNKHRSSST